MKKLLKVHTDFLSGNGLLLHERIRREVDYFEEIQELKWGLKDKVCSKLNHLASSKDKFVENFLSLYHDEVGGHKDSLIFLLLKTYVANAKGHINPIYGAKILDFFLALSVTSPMLELYPTDISVRPHCPESGSRGTGEPHRAEYRPCTDTWKTRGRWVAEAPTKLNTHYHN